MSQPESCATVCDWLSVLRLEQYSEAFKSAGLATLQQCRNLTPDQLERMGITLSGHRRRILASLNKTHGTAQSHLAQSEGDHRSEERGPAKILQRERPLPVPVGTKPAPREREKNDVDLFTPTPKERERPIPKERQVSRMTEGSVEGAEKMPVPVQRLTAPRGGVEGESVGKKDGEKERPVPKERTKFLSSTQVNCHPSPLMSPSDTSLPPVPPRSTPNCPPQRFTSPPSANTPSSPQLDHHDVKAPSAQSRSVPRGSPIHTPTHVPLQPPNVPSAPARPQSLAILPAQHVGGDGGRKASPVSPMASPSSDRNAPPLPPKLGLGPKGPPPVPQRIPAHSPRKNR